LPEFPRAALEALREPLETGHITISRAARQAQYPARFQLVAAMNPCPCGWLGAFAATGRHCRCSPEVVSRYQARLSGPLLDRIDMQVEVPAISAAALMGQADGETSSTVAARVSLARERQWARQRVSNSQIPAGELDSRIGLDGAATRFLQSAADRLSWSGRSLHRVMKLARTIADLAASDRVTTTHVAEAIQYRRALPDC